MKLIEKLRRNSLKGIDKNKKKEYKKTIDTIKSASISGRYTCKYEISLYYVNEEDIYFYIIEKLRKQGFEVDVEKYGCNLSYKRLCINWKAENK